MDCGQPNTTTCLTMELQTTKSVTLMMDHADFELNQRISKDDIDEFSFLSEIPTDFYE